MAYVKLDKGILDSTLWLEDSDTCKVFITMLAMTQPDGLVEATAPVIARRANLSIDRTRKAIGTLEAPDPDSRSTEDDGRRIQRIDGGYEIINYLKYREKDHTNAERQRRHREKLRTRNNNAVTGVTHRAVTGGVTQEEEDTEGKNTHTVCSRTPSDKRFDEFWWLYPKDRRRDKKKAREVWKRKRLDDHADTILDDLKHRPSEDDQWQRGFIPLPTTYLRGERWEDAYAEPREQHQSPFAGTQWEPGHGQTRR